MASLNLLADLDAECINGGSGGWGSWGGGNYGYPSKSGSSYSSTSYKSAKTSLVQGNLANKNGVATVTVRFESQLISATRGRSGEVLAGDPQRITDVTDIWSFAREVSSRNPNWKLVATESAG